MYQDDNWHARAACRKQWVQQAWFFPTDNEDTGRAEYGDDGLRARLICAACPVYLKCWQENRDAEVGIFAGTTEVERTRMMSRAQRREDRDSTRTKRPRRRIGWRDLPAPTLGGPQHVAKPAVGIQVALYAFLRGDTLEAASEIAELPLAVTRRAVAEAQRLVS